MFRFLPCCSALALLLPAPASAQVIPAQPFFISQQQRAEDPRLEQPVTVWKQRVYTGELLEILSEQTGVALSARDDDGSQDEVIAVFVKEQPLVEVLNAVYSLFSYREATSEWVRFGRAGAYRYELRRPEGAHALAARLREDVRRQWDAHVQVMLDAAARPKAERERLAETNRLAFGIGDDRVVAGLLTFLESLAPEQQQAVLRGEQAVRVPVASLSERARTWVAAESRPTISYLLPDGTRRQSGGEPPDWIEFRLFQMPGHIGPTLLIYIAPVALNYLGGNGFEPPMRERLAERWLVVGDRAENPAAERVPLELTTEREKAIREAEAVPSARGSMLRNRVANRLELLAEFHSLPLLARLPPPRGPNIGLLRDGVLLGDYLDRLTSGMSYKWRGEFLLLSQHRWFWEDETEQLPWSVVKRFREAEEDGLLPLDALVAIARMTDAQRTQLEWDLPVLDRFNAQQRALLLVCALTPETIAAAQEEAGVPLELLQPAIEAVTDLSAKAFLETPGAVALRLTVEDGEADGEPVRWYRYQLLGSDGSVVRQRDLALPKHYGGREPGL